MNLEKVKVGVIGVGHLGKHHARNYHEIPTADLIGIYDSNHDAMNQIAGQFNTAAFPAMEDLLNAVDAVSIATPTNTHFTVVQKALTAGCHVLVEKPITKTTAEAENLIDLAKSMGKILQVGHIERFNGAILAIKDRLIKPLFIESHRLAPFNPRGTDVSVVLDLMIHDLDIILSFVKSPIELIHAVGVPVISKSIDIANIRLQFEDGCVANVTTSRVSAKVTRKIRFFQKESYFSVDFHKKAVDIFTKGANLQQFLQQDHSGYTQLKDGINPEILKQQLVNHQTIDAGNVEPLRAELESFIQTIQNNERPVVSGEDGLMALRLAQQIIEIIEKNQHQFH